ncbi:MAG: 50S ribosomal protein L25/general stress protein Ctc [Myxococcales bacterium]|nr:50S ribosomal protein L25/general stress protein Ctc [Myxococcales bacterium]
METQTLKAEVREGRGKGPARQLRAKGLIPAVFYGPGVEAQPIAVSPKELVRALSSEYGRNVVIDLHVDGKQERAMVRELQVEPVSREPLHADFYRVLADREVSVTVPFSTKGRAAGVQKGGELNVVLRSLPLRMTPDKILPKVEVDVTNLQIGQTIAVKDLELPEGVTVALRPDQSLALIQEKRAAKATDEDEAAAPGAAAAAAAKPGAKK